MKTLKNKKLIIAFLIIFAVLLLLCFYWALQNKEKSAGDDKDPTSQVTEVPNELRPTSQITENAENISPSLPVTVTPNITSQASLGIITPDIVSPTPQTSYYPDNISELYMKDSKKGWAILKNGGFIETDDEWETFHQIYDFTGNNAISMPVLTYIEGTLFVAGYLSKEQSIGIYRSEDEGINWVEGILHDPDNLYGGSQLFCRFADNQNGYLVDCGGPALGLMAKTLYRTIDGGTTFQKVGDISYIKGYPTGMAVNQEGEGFITTTYHGNNDCYLYESKDNGQTWKAVTLQLPKKWKVTATQGYINGYPPYFIGDKGYMMLEYVNNQRSFLIFSTSDRGKTWDQDGGIDIEETLTNNIYNYCFSNENTLYIVDYLGKIHQKVKDTKEWK